MKGDQIILELCAHCGTAITAVDLCSYGCPYDATPHRGMTQVTVYEPVAVLRPEQTTPDPKAQSGQTGGTHERDRPAGPAH